jgi:hypothetical protein
MGFVPQVLALHTMGPSTLSTQVDANGRNLKSTTVVEVDANGPTQARSGGNSTLRLKSMAQVLKPAPTAKLLVFSDFSFDFSFRKCLLFFAS